MIHDGFDNQPECEDYIRELRKQYLKLTRYADHFDSCNVHSVRVCNCGLYELLNFYKGD